MVHDLTRPCSFVVKSRIAEPEDTDSGFKVRGGRQIDQGSLEGRIQVLPVNTPRVKSPTMVTVTLSLFFSWSGQVVLSWSLE